MQQTYFEKLEKLGKILEKPADKGAGVVDIKFFWKADFKKLEKFG